MAGPQICSYHKAPTYLQGNKYILHGYRIDFTKLQCIKSILILSNETVNIWSHLVGVIWFLVTIVNVNIKILPGYKLSSGFDHLIVTGFCICFLLCCLFSVMYHIFSCHSKCFSLFWYKLDLFGITLAVWGSYMTSLYYGFYCFKFWRTFYMISLVLFLLVNLYFQVYHTRVSVGVDFRNVLFFILIVLFGLLPAFQWIHISGGFTSIIVHNFAPRILIIYLISGVAVFFYLTKFPERLFPGQFDYIGGSHQIWHCLILFAMIWWYNSCILLISFRLRGDIACPNSKVN